MGQRGAALAAVAVPRAIEATAVAGPIVGLPGGDDETVNHGRLGDGRGRAIQIQDVIGVTVHDVGPRLGDVIAVGVGVIAVDVAAEEGGIGGPVALAPGVDTGLGVEAPVEGHAADEREGGGAVIVRLSRALIGVINTLSHPDFVAARSDGEGILQREVSRTPGRAVVRGAGGVGIHVDGTIGGYRQGVCQQSRTDQ